jgi:RNA recognition motif-containing protein
MFSSFGEIKSAKVVRDSNTRKSLSFGFVKYVLKESALEAIAQNNGLKIGTKRIKVSFARPASDTIKQSKLYVTNLSVDMTEASIRELFEPVCIYFLNFV